MKKEKLIGLRRKNGEKGFTLLEYTAGAAIMAGVVWTAFNLFGVQMDAFMDNLTTWMGNRALEVDTRP